MLYKEPILVLVTIYLSFVYGILYARKPHPHSKHAITDSSICSYYAVFEAVPLIFIEIRGFTVQQDGLVFIPIGIGSCLAAGLNLHFSARYSALMEKWKGFPPPEERLYGGMVAGPCLVVGALWLGWTGQYPAIHWVVPALGMILIGTSVCLIFVSLVAYVVDVYL
jgi:MFS transporter, DHA1 family, multidrug resistance protein